MRPGRTPTAASILRSRQANAERKFSDACTAKAEALRTLMFNRIYRCSPTCRGWTVNADLLVVELCDPCIKGSGLQSLVGDADAAALPEAREAVARMLRGGT